VSGRPATVAALAAAIIRVEPRVGKIRAEIEAMWMLRETFFDNQFRIPWARTEWGRRFKACLCEEQNHRCCYCGIHFGQSSDPSEATIEHITPLSRGGQDHPDNIAIACRGCNTRRSAGETSIRYSVAGGACPVLALMRESAQ
jgi:5-methylcytosine-specific restriction endonuclease McrA